jgi:hypothetical protein
MGCIHNQRTRYADGYYCEDCDTFFHKDSAEYRKTEYMETLWMTLHNISVGRHEGGLDSKEVEAMRDEIGIDNCENHDNYEDIIKRAEKLIRKVGGKPNDSELILN